MAAYLESQIGKVDFALDALAVWQVIRVGRS